MADAPGPHRPLPADGGRARLGAPVPAAAGRRSSSGTASAGCSRTTAASSRLVARGGRCSVISPSCGRLRRAALPAHSALDGEIVIATRRRARLRRDADAPPSRREPRPEALRRDPGHVRRFRSPVLERQAAHERPSRSGAPRSRRSAQDSNSPPSPTTSSRDATGCRPCRRPASTASSRRSSASPICRARATASSRSSRTRRPTAWSPGSAGRRAGARRSPRSCSASTPRRAPRPSARPRSA